MTEIGLLLIILGAFGFLTGLILACIESTRRAGLITMLCAFAFCIIGFSVCSSFPFRLH